jgi:trigger factor
MTTAPQLRLPRVRLGEYKGLEIPRPTLEPVEPEDLEREVGLVREQARTLTPAGRGARPGDLVTFDFTSRHGDATGIVVRLGSGVMAPGFEEQLEGAVAGESRKVTVRFPRSYPGEALAGRQVTFNVTVGRVEEAHVPQADDSFAEQRGYGNLTALREHLMERLLNGEKRRVEILFRYAVLDRAADDADIRVTPSMVKKALGNAEPTPEAQESAERTLRREATLRAIIANEHIRPTDQDLRRSEFVRSAAQASHRNVHQVLADYRRRPDGMAELRLAVAREQALKLLAESAVPVLD